jgi:hypothetical protein
MNSVLVSNPKLARYFIGQDLLEWCDGWWMAFLFGDVRVLVTNEYEYFTEIWILQMGQVKVTGYLTYAGVMDILNQLAAQVVDVPSLADPLVVEGEVRDVG